MPGKEQIPSNNKIVAQGSEKMQHCYRKKLLDKMSSANAWVIQIFVCLLERVKRKATRFQLMGMGRSLSIPGLLDESRAPKGVAA